jgi:RHS repeat-associated protein
MRVGTDWTYFLTDHLGFAICAHPSAARGALVATTDASGALTAETRYLPFGEVRTDVGTISSTDYGYTFQREVASTGLMDYKARAYDPSLGRFVQPDSIVPSAANPQAYNRYGYVNDNPLKYNDPSGHRFSDVMEPVEKKIIKDMYQKNSKLLPKALSNWEEIKDDKVELVARALLSEEGDKFFTNRESDVVGVVWVLRNRYYQWYKNGQYKDTVPPENWWLKATTSGILGMVNNNKLGYSIDVLEVRPKRYH